MMCTMKAEVVMTDVENKIVEYALTFSGAYLDYPFHNDIAAIRLRQNKKNFVFIINRNGQIWANMKCEPLKADFWRRIYKSVTQGYHMNDKSRWNTVIMDGSVPWDVIEEMIGESYDMIKPKLKKKE